MTLAVNPWMEFLSKTQGNRSNIDGGRADLPRRSWQKLMRKEVRSDLNSGEGAQPGSSNAT
jgi:hypothetical protein